MDCYRSVPLGLAPVIVTKQWPHTDHCSVMAHSRPEYIIHRG